MIKRFIQYEQTRLANVQVKALPGGVVTEGITEIIPAPGAGKIIVPLSIFTITHFSAGAYTNVSADAQVAFILGSLISSYVDITITLKNNGASAQVTSFLGAESRFILWPIKTLVEESGAVPGAYITNLPGSHEAIDVINKPLQLYCYNAAGDFTGGNAANTLDVTAAYVVVDV